MTYEDEVRERLGSSPDKGLPDVVDKNFVKEWDKEQRLTKNLQQWTQFFENLAPSGGIIAPFEARMREIYAGDLQNFRMPTPGGMAWIDDILAQAESRFLIKDIVPSNREEAEFLRAHFQEEEIHFKEGEDHLEAMFEALKTRRRAFIKNLYDKYSAVAAPFMHELQLQEFTQSVARDYPALYFIRMVKFGGQFFTHIRQDAGKATSTAKQIFDQLSEGQQQRIKPYMPSAVPTTRIETAEEIGDIPATTACFFKTQNGAFVRVPRKMPASMYRCAEDANKRFYLGFSGVEEVPEKTPSLVCERTMMAIRERSPVSSLGFFVPRVVLP
jgi:hypothetical protein